MNNETIINSKTGTLTILLADPVTELATNKIMELVNDLKNNNTSTILYEFNSYEKWYELNSKKEKLKKSKIYLEQKSYLEKICYITRNYKAPYDIQYLIIDGLQEISTMTKYELGRLDIISIIIKQLKELAQELNISIIATAPTKPKIYELNSDKSKLLSYFCKAKTAKDYIDEIIILEKE